MGRGRGKGKKLTLVSSHDELGSGGEEAIPTYKRRGRPQKPLKNETEDEEVEKTEEIEGEEDIKPKAPSKEFRGQAQENGAKRRRRSQVKENRDSSPFENGAGQKSSNGDSVIYNGFRQNGSRRKSKPRRAAEAGVDCD